MPHRRKGDRDLGNQFRAAWFGCCLEQLLRNPNGAACCLSCAQYWGGYYRADRPDLCGAWRRGDCRSVYDLLASARLVIVIKIANFRVIARCRFHRCPDFVDKEIKFLPRPPGKIISYWQRRVTERHLFAGPDIPQPVDVGVMQEEYRIDRRKAIQHKAPAVVVAAAPDAIMDKVVRGGFENAKSDNLHIMPAGRLRTRKGEEVRRTKCLVYCLT